MRPRTACTRSEPSSRPSSSRGTALKSGTRNARHILSGAWLLSLALLAACANPLPPPGGPVDEVEPWLAVARPESASTGHGPIDELRFGFSEKMDRSDAYRWLTIYPKRTIRGTSWKGATEAVVTLEEPLPADTTVVIELAPGMKDKHGVPQPRGRTWVFATGDSIDDGVISGELVLEDEPLGGAVVEIIPALPDTVPLAQRPVLRRAVSDSAGSWRLRWLPASGEAWLLRAYDDRNKDRRAGDQEAQRLFPDTLRLAAGQSQLAAGLRVIYSPSTPGRLEGRLADRPDTTGPVLAFVAAIAEGDTGYVGAAQQPSDGPGLAIPDTGAFVLDPAGPGLVRAVFFVDMDGDSLLSAFGDPADTLWNLEPWALVDSVEVEPGLPREIAAPVWPDTLTPWPAPVIPDSTAADSLAAALLDSLGPAALDSLSPAELDSLRGILADSLEAAELDSLGAPVAPPEGDR